MEMDLSTISSNRHRAAAILAAVKTIALHSEPNLENVGRLCAKLGPTFDPLDDAELKAACNLLAQESDETNSSSEPEPQSAIATEPPPASEQSPAERLRLAHANLCKARATVMILSEKRRQARDTLAMAIQNYQNGSPSSTFESLIRDTIKSNQQYKQDVKDGKVAPRQRPVLRSGIDATAHYSRGGSPAGGGNSFRRGASMKQGGFRPPKPPSEL
jgi:hypothetical protein